jgi:hypothetical protein
MYCEQFLSGGWRVLPCDASGEVSRDGLGGQQALKSSLEGRNLLFWIPCFVIYIAKALDMGEGGSYLGGGVSSRVMLLERFLEMVLAARKPCRRFFEPRGVSGPSPLVDTQGRIMSRCPRI